MRLSKSFRYVIAIVALVGAMLETRNADAQPLPNSPCGYCSWIELINDPIADGLVTEDGVTGYVYVYDVWIANGGTDNWEASYGIGGTRGPLGPAGTFDGRQAAWYRESQLPQEQLADDAYKGVWSVWNNANAGKNSQAPEGAYVESSESAPSAVWDDAGEFWDTSVVDEGDWTYTYHWETNPDPSPEDATMARFADVGLGNPLPWAMDNPYHVADDYRWSSEYRYPGIQWANIIPVDQGLVWGKAGGVWSGWDDGLEATLRIVHPNSPGSMNYSFVNGGAKNRGVITGPTGDPVPQITCAIGDANCDGYVDIGGDILPGFSNFTGPGSFGKTRVQGDVEGSATGATTNLDPHDGDVDVSDLLTMFGNFTGPPPDESGDGGLAPAEVGDPSIPDLIYDSATGEVVLDVDGSGIIGYVLKNGAGTFVPGNHTPILGGVTTSLAGELSEAALSSPGGANSIGFVFPTGMNLAALGAYLTTNEVSRSLGAPIVPFDLVVLSAGPPVPEPATLVLSVLGLLGMGLVAYRRRRVA